MLIEIHSRRSILVLSLSLISACNPLKSPTPLEAPTEKSDFLPYKVITKSEDGVERAIELNVVNAAKPDVHVNVEKNEFGDILVFPAMIQTGVFDADNFTVSHYHTSHILYSSTVSNVGKLMALPIFQVEKPEPFRISNEKTMYRACPNDIRRANDYADQSNSRIVYKIMPSLDLSNCEYNSGEYRMVRLSTPSNVGPAPLPSTINFIVEPIHDLKTAALTGWLVVDDHKLTRYDVEFRSPKIVTRNGDPVTVTNFARLLLRTRDHHFLIIVDNHLLHYDPRSDVNTVSANHAGFIPDENSIVDQYVSTGSEMYFTVTSADAEKGGIHSSDLYKLSLQSGQLAQKIITEPNGIGYITLTNNYLAYMTGGVLKGSTADEFPFFTEVRRIRLSDGTQETLSLPNDVESLYAMRSEKDQLYINTRLNGTSAMFALFVFSDGNDTPQRFDHYRLVGTAFDHVLYPYRDSFNIRYLMFFQHNPDTDERLLFSMDASTGAHKAHLGVFGAKIFDNSADFSFSVRGHSLGLFHAPVLGDGHFNLYYFNAEKDDSLHQIDAPEFAANRAIYHKPGSMLSSVAETRIEEIKLNAPDF